MKHYQVRPTAHLQTTSLHAADCLALFVSLTMSLIITRSIPSYSRLYFCQLQRLNVQLGLLSSFAQEALPRPTLTASSAYRSPNPPKVFRLISIMPSTRRAKRKLGQFVNDTIAQTQASPKKLRKKLTRNPAAMSTMAATPSSAANDDGIDYQSLASFVEQQMKDPKPITSIQRRLLTELTSSLKDEEPDIGGFDWISLLQKYIDAHKAKTDMSITYKDEAVSAAPNTKWNCILTFKPSAENPILFPYPHQLVHSGFAKKKDAKKYAAKCCVEKLMAEGLMPRDGIKVTFQHGTKAMMASTSKIYSPLSSQPSSPNPHVAAQVGHGSSTATTPTQSSPSKTPSATTRPSDSTTSLLDPPGGAPLGLPEDDDGVDTAAGESPSKRVAALCEKLGFRPPRYVLTARAGQDALYDGYADMGADSWIVPDEVGEKDFGRVSGVYGKKFAKEMVAQTILGVLEAETRRRGEEVKGVWGGSS